MFEQAFKNIDDILWKEAGCASELDYTEQTSWLLFLKYLDGLEQDKAMEAELEGKQYEYILSKPYRWETWAAPKNKDGKLDHNKAMTGDDPLFPTTLMECGSESRQFEVADLNRKIWGSASPIRTIFKEDLKRLPISLWTASETPWFTLAKPSVNARKISTRGARTSVMKRR